MSRFTDFFPTVEASTGAYLAKPKKQRLEGRRQPEWYTNNDIANYEGYYASVFYSYFAALGLDIVVEDSSSHGRLDMAVLFNSNVYLFEFKVVELVPEGAAMARSGGTPTSTASGRADPPDRSGVHRESRNVVAFEVVSALERQEEP